MQETCGIKICKDTKGRREMYLPIPDGGRQSTRNETFCKFQRLGTYLLGKDRSKGKWPPIAYLEKSLHTSVLYKYPLLAMCWCSINNFCIVLSGGEL